jgi:hypothetical protein
MFTKDMKEIVYRAGTDGVSHPDTDRLGEVIATFGKEGMPLSEDERKEAADIFYAGIYAVPYEEEHASE